MRPVIIRLAIRMLLLLPMLIDKVFNERVLSVILIGTTEGDNEEGTRWRAIQGASTVSSNDACTLWPSYRWSRWVSFISLAVINFISCGTIPWWVSISNNLVYCENVTHSDQYNYTNDFDENEQDRTKNNSFAKLAQCNDTQIIPNFVHDLFFTRMWIAVGKRRHMAHCNGQFKTI